ncbi:MAG: hypothetical protein J0L77_06575 [Alphaproteobacteria bacterium]|nr:hypothetical protein [Alphaproteobacteria bacterium]
MSENNKPLDQRGENNVIYPDVFRRQTFNRTAHPAREPSTLELFKRALAHQAEGQHRGTIHVPHCDWGMK